MLEITQEAKLEIREYLEKINLEYSDFLFILRKAKIFDVFKVVNVISGTYDVYYLDKSKEERCRLILDLSLRGNTSCFTLETKNNIRRYEVKKDYEVGRPKVTIKEKRIWEKDRELYFTYAKSHFSANVVLCLNTNLVITITNPLELKEKKKLLNPFRNLEKVERYLLTVKDFSVEFLSKEVLSILDFPKEYMQECMPMSFTFKQENEDRKYYEKLIIHRGKVEEYVHKDQYLDFEYIVDGSYRYSDNKGNDIKYYSQNKEYIIQKKDSGKKVVVEDTRIQMLIVKAVEKKISNIQKMIFGY